MSVKIKIKTKIKMKMKIRIKIKSNSLPVILLVKAEVPPIVRDAKLRPPFERLKFKLRNNLNSVRTYRV